MAGADEDGKMAIDTERYGYIIDKGPVCAISKAPEGMGESDINLFSFRAFGCPSPYAVHANIPGHYIVDMMTLVDQPSAQVLELPAIVTFKDPGTPAMFGLNFKAASNGKLYVNCIPTSLKTKPDPDKDYKHITDKDIRLLNISLIANISCIADQNGQPFRKNFNAWLKEGHSASLKRLKIKSLMDITVRLRPSAFSKNVSDAVQGWVEDFDKESAADCGDSDSNPIDANSTAEISATNKTLVDQHAALVKKVKGELHQHVQALAVSLGFRVIEVDLSEPVTVERIERWLDKAVAPNHTDALRDSFKNSGLLDELKEQANVKKPLPVNSPVKGATDATARTARTESPDAAIQSPDSVSDETQPFEMADMTLRKRKGPTPPVQAPASASSSGARKTPGTGRSSSSSACGSEEISRRKYIKSGRYSKNPLQRAQQIADAAHGSKKDKGPQKQDSNSGKGVCIACLMCICIIVCANPASNFELQREIPRYARLLSKRRK